MFEITGDDISLLHDEDLRALVGLLCETEARQAGLSPLGVTWGGDQNAADGGLDVRVALPPEAKPLTNLPRLLTGFQVKAEDMPRAAILAEIRPRGKVRAVIQELAEASGAYIIVSSKGSVSDSSLGRRRAAMLHALRDLPNVESLHLDFYDRNRLATWVRDHASRTCWVRERIGRAVPGWTSYGSWAAANESPDAEYLLDDELRIHGPDERGKNVSALEGIQNIRVRLSLPHGVVRLVGLSGVGKTRLAQALFDKRLGDGSLDPSLAIYTNLSDDPTPQPVALASDLVTQRKRAIVIVDNCPPDLHRRLSEVCRGSGSQLSLLTVEYDIQEDQPEGTDVFELYRSSDELIERLLGRRFPNLSQVNVQSVARFAGGNAKVAIALASTVQTGESVADLRDAELFRRLFYQRHDPNDLLLQTAQACSLAYSFQGEDVSRDENAELWRLTEIIGRDIQSVYSDLSELRRRDLLQHRGAWRALLPHAIANRLAALALENVPRAALQRFWETAPARLLKSFSRRLGYLHTSSEARSIVAQWLSADGLLGKLGSLGDLGISMFANVAPVAPAAALNAIDRAINEAQDNGVQLKGEPFRSLLLSLAYEADLFDTSVTLLFELIEAEQPGPYANQVRRSFSSLFHVYLSGTHATIEQRLAIIESLLLSQSQQRRGFGVSALEAALKTSHFSSFHHFDFGAWPRDFGSYPRTRTDILHWFRPILALCKKLVLNDAIASQIRKVVADNLRGLWSDAGMYDEVADVCRLFSARDFWPEGWAAIRSIRRWHEEPLAPDLEARFCAIEEDLRPRTLVERARALVLGGVDDELFDAGDDYHAQLDRMQTAALELGKDVARDEKALTELLPELVTAKGTLTFALFLKGLIDGSVAHRELWGPHRGSVCWRRTKSKIGWMSCDLPMEPTECGFGTWGSVARREFG